MRDWIIFQNSFDRSWDVFWPYPVLKKKLTLRSGKKQNFWVTHLSFGLQIWSKLQKKIFSPICILNFTFPLKYVWIRQLFLVFLSIMENKSLNAKFIKRDQIHSTAEEHKKKWNYLILGWVFFQKKKKKSKTDIKFY